MHIRGSLIFLWPTFYSPSRSGSHISKVFQNDEVRPLVREISVSSGEGSVISLDGADVGNDTSAFLRHSFKELENQRMHLAKLASRAGRHFIVASTVEVTKRLTRKLPFQPLFLPSVSSSLNTVNISQRTLSSFPVLNSLFSSLL